MGGEYIPMILSLQWIIVFEETSEISAEFGFFPVSTKMKAHWACASTFRRLKSYIISFLYLFASFVMAIFYCWGKTWASFEEISLVSACRSTSTYNLSIVFFTLCKNRWRVYRLLIIFSASGFPVIIKLQPATCKIYLPGRSEDSFLMKPTVYLKYAVFWYSCHNPDFHQNPNKLCITEKLITPTPPSTPYQYTNHRQVSTLPFSI